MYKFKLILLALAGSVVNAFSQTADAYLENFTLETGTTSTYTFDISAQRTGSAKWGLGDNSTFIVNFTEDAFVTTASSDITFGTESLVVGGTTNYSLSGTFLSTSSLEVTVHYTGNNSGANALTTKTTIARLTLKVLNTDAVANLSWGSANILKTNGGTVTTTTSGTDQTALPVSLISFDVYSHNGTGALLNWATASEENNKGFYIERSLDGRNWSIINFVETKAVNGNSQQITRYSYTDENIYRPYSRTNTFYYRLRQQDFNGTEEYVGRIRSVRFGERAETLMQLSPNPVTNYLNVRSNYTGVLTAVVTDLSGKQIHATNFESSTVIDMQNMNAGLYIVTVKNASGEVVGSQKLSVTR